MERIKISKEWRFESYIGWSQSWWSYYNQYREASRVLLDRVNNNYPIDTVAMPIIFLIRHSLELGLKANIIELEKFSSARPKLKFDGRSHNISYLHEYFIAHLDKIILEFKITDHKILSEIDNFKTKLNNLKDIIHGLDSNSYRFRYPVDPKGNQNFNYTDKFLLVDCIELIQDLDPLLLYLTNVLAEFGVIDMNDFIVE